MPAHGARLPNYRAEAAIYCAEKRAAQDVCNLDAQCEAARLLVRREIDLNVEEARLRIGAIYLEALKGELRVLHLQNLHSAMMRALIESM